MFRPAIGGQRFSFTSEDGAIFTVQARRGVWKSFHTTYSGYYHLLPRSVAAVASALPLRWTPPIYAVAAALIAAVAATVAARSVAALGFSRPFVLLVGALVLVLPGSGFDPVLALLMVEWYCLAAVVVFVAAWLAGYQPPLRWMVPLVAVAGLTSPLLWVTLLFIIPVTALRRSRCDVALLGTVLAVTVIQGISSLRTGTPRGSWSVGEIARYYGVRAAGGAFGGARFERAEWNLLGSDSMAVIAGLLVAVLLLVFVLSSGDRRLIGCYFVINSILFVAAAVLLRPTHLSFLGFLVLDGHVDLWNGRYYAVPALCLFLAVVLLLEGPALRPTRHSPATVAAQGVMAVLSLVVLANFQVRDLHRPSLTDYETQISAAKALCQRHHEAGSFTVKYGVFALHPDWLMIMTCRQGFG